MNARQAQFEALVNAHSADLYRYAVWLVRDAQLAEDLVQETFMRAWKAIDTLREPALAKTWLITILRRERVRAYEKRRAEGDTLDNVDLDALSAFDLGHGKTEHFVLRRALDALPEDYREPLLMQIIGGYSCNEIAAAMNLQPGAVMTRLSRARQKLLRLLDGGHEAVRHNEAVS
ncbi:MAG: sigma-70 family RNA polymerase sigma factor [Sulfurifustis sp.]